MIEAQRRDAEARGPVHNTIAMVVNGIVSLRAAEKLPFFRQDFTNNLELGCNATFCYVIANRWIAIRLDILCALFIAIICISVVYLKDSVDSSFLIMTL